MKTIGKIDLQVTDNFIKAGGLFVVMEVQVLEEDEEAVVVASSGCWENGGLLGEKIHFGYPISWSKEELFELQGYYKMGRKLVLMIRLFVVQFMPPEAYKAYLWYWSRWNWS
ncbi:uncharacterized protein LOC113307574 isoform X2 [Papaver somniferum]|uniref:uncharacterized protein LOC113307574 isoform X2 n=1 Tax=Papaver somniferum TaxID=3469 RepID=UPI000E702350|nr:uncharacterized protein LOC113307574 isoform X2 [Papaver somniferum]